MASSRLRGPSRSCRALGLEDLVSLCVRPLLLAHEEGRDGGRDEGDQGEPRHHHDATARPSGGCGHLTHETAPREQGQAHHTPSA